MLCLCFVAVMHSSNIASQVFQPFIFREGTFFPDTALQSIANRGMDHYYHKEYDSALVCYKRLLEMKKDYYQGYFNMAVFYAKMSEPKHAIDALTTYIKLAGERCNYPALMHSTHFRSFRDSSRFGSLLKQARDSDARLKEKVSQPALREKLFYWVTLEQEWLGNSSMSVSERNDSIRASVFEPFLQQTDTAFLPGKKELGAAAAYLSLLILHADYLPSAQVSLGMQMLDRRKGEFDPKHAAYIVDRGLHNLHSPQRFGTILNTAPSGELSVYEVDDWAQMVQRRKSLDFQPIEEYLQNLNIYK